MSGNVDEPKVQAELTTKIMEQFKVNEETAGMIIDFAVTEAQDMMQKWTANVKRNQKNKAEEIYELVKQWKRKIKAHRDSTAILGEIERKILGLCVG